MIIPSDTSDISDWRERDCGFPCRDKIRERNISDNCSQYEPPIPSLDPQATQGNIKSEILDNQPSTSDPLDCPISIIPAGQNSTQHQQTTHFPLDLETKPSSTPTEPWKKLEGDKSVDFRIYEIVDSSDDNATTQGPRSKEISTTGNEFKLRRSSRNLGPPQFYSKRFYMDIIHDRINQPGSALNQISLDGNTNTSTTQIPSDKKTPFFSIHSVKITASSSDSSSLDTFSICSTDQSLREAVNSFDELVAFDSELFNAELEKFIEGDNFQN